MSRWNNEDGTSGWDARTQGADERMRARMGSSSRPPKTTPADAAGWVALLGTILEGATVELGYLSASVQITAGDRSIAWLVEGAPRTTADTAATLRRLGLEYREAPLLALDTDPWDPADTYWNAGLGEWTRPALPIVEITPDA